MISFICHQIAKVKIPIQMNVRSFSLMDSSGQAWYVAFPAVESLLADHSKLLTPTLQSLLCPKQKSTHM